MAAVGERIRGARSHAEALAAVESWMSRQIKKLRAKAEREGRRSSWWREPEGAAGAGRAGSLGEELVRVVAEESYLTAPGGSAESAAGDLDRLAALQRFWERFHGLYRYQGELGEPMPLGALDLRT
jgi:hypothetical protein